IEVLLQQSERLRAAEVQRAAGELQQGANAEQGGGRIESTGHVIAGVEGEAADAEGLGADRAVTCLEAAESGARVDWSSGVDTTEQRVQVDVAVRRDQGVGDGVGSAVGARDRGVDVLIPVAQV